MKNEFVKIDPQRILNDIIASYENKIGVTLNPADAERLMIDCMAYREVVLRTLMNDAMSNNFVQLARDESLDMWGELFGAERKEGESDDDFRERIMLANKTSIGTADAYKARILSVDGIVDAKVLRQTDDETITPGNTVISALQIKDNGGSVPDPNHKLQIITTLNDSSFAILGAKVTYKEPVAVAINGTIEIVSTLNQSDEAKREAKVIVDSYVRELSKNFSARFEVLNLEQELLKADSIYQVIDMDFSVESLKGVDYYTLGTITINV